MKRVTLRMNEALYQIIKEQATREHRSIHAEILVVLEGFFGKGRTEGTRPSEGEGRTSPRTR